MDMIPDIVFPMDVIGIVKIRKKRHYWVTSSWHSAPHGVPQCVWERIDAHGKTPGGYSSRKGGWVLFALQNAFFHLRRDATVEDALVATVGKGGDTDTNAAIAGALLGPAYGLARFLPVGSCRSRPAGPTTFSALSDPGR